MKERVIYYPHDALRKKAEPVTTFDSSLHALLKAMKRLLKKHKGLGLAAPQIDRNLQCFLVHYEEQIHVFINPTLVSSSSETIYYSEGCLSLPGVFAEVERPKRIHVRAQNKSGDFFEIESDDFFARIILHEYDHLQGRLFIDLLSERERAVLLEEYQNSFGQQETHSGT